MLVVAGILWVAFLETQYYQWYTQQFGHPPAYSPAYYSYDFYIPFVPLGIIILVTYYGLSSNDWLSLVIQGVLILFASIGALATFIYFPILSNAITLTGCPICLIGSIITIVAGVLRRS